MHAARQFCTLPMRRNDIAGEATDNLPAASDTRFTIILDRQTALLLPCAAASGSGMAHDCLDIRRESFPLIPFHHLPACRVPGNAEGFFATGESFFSNGGRLSSLQTSTNRAPPYRRLAVTRVWSDACPIPRLDSSSQSCWWTVKPAIKIAELALDLGTSLIRRCVP